MQELTRDVTVFLEQQGFGIVSTLDVTGSIHCAAKGLAGLDPNGRLWIIDLYRGRTFTNLKRTPAISFTVVDEHKFCGYVLKGTAAIVDREKIEKDIIKGWEERVIKRVSRRLIKNVQGERKSAHHPEVKFPPPQYLIEMTVDVVVDLSPAHLKGR